MSTSRRVGFVGVSTHTIWSKIYQKNSYRIP